MLRVNVIIAAAAYTLTGVSADMQYFARGGQRTRDYVKSQISSDRYNIIRRPSINSDRGYYAAARARTHGNGRDFHRTLTQQLQCIYLHSHFSFVSCVLGVLTHEHRIRALP